MKKFVTIFMLLVLAVCCLFALTACGEKFIGTWTYEAENGTGATIVIDKDGVGELSIKGEGMWADLANEAISKYRITYTLNGRILTISVPEMGASLSGEFNSDYTSLSVDMPGSSEPTVFVKS